MGPIEGSKRRSWNPCTSTYKLFARMRIVQVSHNLFLLWHVKNLQCLQYRLQRISMSLSLVEGCAALLGEGI